VLKVLQGSVPADVFRLVVGQWISINRPFVHRQAGELIPRSMDCGNAWYRYQKLGRLILWVEATALEGSPESLLRCIEGFVGDAHQRWLKIAGGPKADVVDDAVAKRPLGRSEVCVEMGCFVGYTAIRLGWRFWEQAREEERRPMRHSGVLSTEFDAIHICVARRHLDAAHLATIAEVWPGHIPWITPRYVEQFGWRGVGFTFMDHKGTRFHQDFDDCRASCLWGPRSRLLCDNVLKPGAPEHLWRHHRASSAAASVWLLHEFMEPEAEDWQSLYDEPPHDC